MKEKFKKLFWCILVAIIIVACFGVAYWSCFYGEPNEPIIISKFHDNETQGYMYTTYDHINSLENTKKIFNSNDSTQFLVRIAEEGYSNLSVKYAEGTIPDWSEILIRDMGNNKFLVDCIKTKPNETITYCVSATNKKGELEEFYFSYVIR